MKVEKKSKLQFESLKFTNIVYKNDLNYVRKLN